MKKLLACLLVIIMCLQITGCGADRKQEPERQGNQSGAGDGKITYIAELLELPHESTMYEVAWQNIIYYVRDYFTREGNAEEKNVICRLDMNQNELVPVELPFVPEDGHRIEAMTVDSEGKLHILSFQREGVDENSKLQEVLWISLDENGNKADSRSVLELFEKQEYAYAANFLIDEEANAYIDTGNTVYVLNKEGVVVYEAVSEGYISKLCRDKDGRIYMLGFNSEYIMELTHIDAVNKSPGSRQDMDWLGMAVGTGINKDGNVIFANESKVYSYDLEQKTHQELLTWADLDIVADYTGNFLTLDEERYLWVSRDYSGETVKSELMLIRPWQEGDPNPGEKTILTFGGVSIYIEEKVKNAIVAFNRSNPDFRIEIKEYGTEDVQEGFTQLSADIVSGNCPDILILPVWFSMDMYADKGVLEDLYPYMDSDGSMERADFQENILKAYETDGKLYGIPIYYFIETMLGKSSLLEGRTSWNLDEMIAFAEEYIDESEIFNFATKSSVLDICLVANRDMVISGGKEFDRESFSKILEFANRFASAEKYTYDEDFIRKMEDGQLLLWDTMISDIAAEQLYSAMFGEPTTYIGYPTEGGSGSLVSSYSVISINSSCAEKEAVWQFVSSMLSEEFQGAENLNSGFAIRKSGLEKQFERAMEAEYTTDENGEQKETPKSVYGMGDFRIDVYAAKPEDVQRIRDLIASVNQRQDRERQISRIINEESDAYFSGDKTAEEVMDIIENRISLYINESK